MSLGCFVSLSVGDQLPISPYTTLLLPARKSRTESRRSIEASDGDLCSPGRIGVIPGKPAIVGAQAGSETGTATGDGHLRSEASMMKSKPKSTQPIEFFSLSNAILPSVCNQS